MSTAEELKTIGNAHFINKEYREAVQAYTDAIGLDKASPVLYSNRSAAHVGNGNAKAALKDAEASLEIDESYTKGFLRKCKALSALGRPAHAEHALKEGFEKFPDDIILIQGLKDFYLEEDGDQSKLRGIFPGSPAQNMRDFQSEQGMKIGTGEMFYSLPHAAFRWALVGDLDSFKKEYDPIKHSKMRCWGVKLPLTSLIVSGAQRFVKGPLTPQFEEILKLVLENGWCRVDALDIAGYSALSHATGHHPTLELAKILLEYGADPSSRNRMGATPLFTAIMSQEFEATKLLLDAGSDPKAVDYEGASLQQIAAVASPKIVAMLHEKMNLNQENKDIAPGGNCNNPTCGKPGATRRCGECRLAIYCNRDCQKQAWKQHKKVCGKNNTAGGSDSNDGGTAGSTGTLRLKIYGTKGVESMIPSTAVGEMISRAWGLKDGGTMTAAELDAQSIDVSQSTAKAAKEANMVIKVQVPVRLAPGQKNEMLLYNKSRSFQAHCDGGKGAGRELANLIKSKGIQGAKGYFIGYVEKEGDLTVLIDKMLPAQPW
jgi:tetratricopeptide (TPR) repeat protein